MSDLIPKPVRLTAKTVRLPDAMWDEIARVAGETLDDEGKPVSENYAHQHLLRWALEEYGRRTGKKPTKK